MDPDLHPPSLLGLQVQVWIHGWRKQEAGLHLHGVDEQTQWTKYKGAHLAEVSTTGFIDSFGLWPDADSGHHRGVSLLFAEQLCKVTGPEPVPELGLMDRHNKEPSSMSRLAL